ncbi:hypothetical protein ACS0TY_031476 [Phlomoides rotata]
MGLQKWYGGELLVLVASATTGDKKAWGRLCDINSFHLYLIKRTSAVNATPSDSDAMFPRTTLRFTSSDLLILCSIFRS